MSEKENPNVPPIVTKQAGSIKSYATNVLGFEKCLHIIPTQDIKP